MIIEVSLKTPDALRDAITAQVTQTVEQEQFPEDCSPQETEYLVEDEVNKI